MNCPNCKNPMIDGEARFRKSASDFAAFGLGSADLWMTKATGGNELLLVSTEKAAAKFCEECGVAVIATEKGRRSAVKKVGK